MYHPLDAKYLYCAYKLTMQFLDENGQERGPFSGTCFFIKSKPHPFLITNRHNVDAGYSDSRKSGWSLKSLQVSGYDGEWNRFSGEIVEYIMPIYPSVRDEDVAVLVPMKLVTGDGRTDDLSPISIDRNVLAPEAFFNDIFASDLVVFPGFPEWHDVHSVRPIMRSGIISSDPRTDYTGPSMTPGARRIAFEALSFEGSSGSPVFSLPYGIRLGAGLSGKGMREAHLIGINLGHSKDQGSGLHSGISRMIKSTVILELIGIMEQFLGVSVVEYP